MSLNSSAYLRDVESAPSVTAVSDEDQIIDQHGKLPNLGLVKARIRAYYGDYLDGDGRHQCSFDSAWASEVAAVIAEAKAYLANRLDDGVRQPALILDVDDTAVTTYPYLANKGFGLRQNRELLPAIPPTRDLACWAHARDVAIFYITERPVERHDDTVVNLRHVGFPEPTELFLRTRAAPYPRYLPAPDCPPAAFKSATRAHIRSMGYHVLASVGDQHSDLSGGHVDRTFKLPNPMYYTP